MTVEAAADPILRIDHVTKRFGGLVAVDDVTFDVKKGEIFALIGPNGAGKTTLFNGITGIFPPTAGRIVFQGREITGAKPHQVAAFGIARTFQNIRLFEYMSSLDNVRLGQHCRRLQRGFRFRQWRSRRDSRRRFWRRRFCRCRR